MVTTLKFSQFMNGGNVTNGTTTVGLGGGTNEYFDNPWTFLPAGTTADRPAINPAIFYRLRLNTDTQLYEYYNSVTANWDELESTNQFTWETVTTDPIQMLANTGYITNSGSLIHLALPTIAGIGDVVAIAGFGAGGWIITQIAGQSIIIAPTNTTVGVTGTLASTDQYNTLSLVCIEENLTWTTNAPPQGSLTIV